MALNTTTYEAAPYYDDYTSSNVEGKGYLKILFKPGQSVQTRELNQLQTLIQQQIDRYGLHTFKNGAPVLDGQPSLLNNVDYVDVSFTNAALKINTSSSPLLSAVSSANAIANLIDIDQGYVDGMTSTTTQRVQMSAKILHKEILQQDNEATRYRFYIQYTKKNEYHSRFQEGSDLRNAGTAIGTVSKYDVVGKVTKVGYAGQLHINKGVYFIDGYFVQVQATDVYIEKPNENFRFNGKIALKVNEKITQYGDDNTLLDNSSGTPNASAPGADRYSMELAVVFLSNQNQILNISKNQDIVFPISKDSSTTNKFVPVTFIENNLPIRPYLDKYNSIDGRLGATIAKRTYEESGNYVLKPFIIDVREAYNDGANRGRFETLKESEKTALKSQYALGIEPSVAYVEGYRVELLNKKELLHDKARDQVFNEEVFTPVSTGFYIEGDLKQGLPLFNGSEVFVIKDGANGTGSTLGNGVKILSVDKVGQKFRAYITLEAGTHARSIGLAKSIVAPANFVDGNSGDSGLKTIFNASATGTKTFKLLGNGNNNSTLFILPRKNISSVDTTKTEFTSKDIYETNSSNGVSSLVLSSINSNTQDQIVLTLDPSSSAKFFDTDINDYLATDETGAVFTPESVVISNAQKTITLVFPTSTRFSGVSSGDATTTTSAEVKLYASTRSTKNLATKNLHTGITTTVALATTNVTRGTEIPLTQTHTNNAYGGTGGSEARDIIRISQITIDGVSQTLSDFGLDNGQRRNSYKQGKAVYQGTGTLNSGTLVITYDHFTHTESGSDDNYFSRESYPATFDYGSIPSYGGIRLTDALDFRGEKGLSPSANTNIRSEIDYYLGRVDQLIVDTSGKFTINRGTPAVEPTIPDTPKGAMVLYNLTLPPYTFDAASIKIDYIDHRRYTMRDIGKIDKRVKNLEYYTSLSLLEKEASDQEIFGEDGVERFKNGIIVDSFTGHNVGDVFDPDYSCAVDGKLGVLRPKYEYNNIGFNIANDGVYNEDLIMLPRTNFETLTANRLSNAHESVQPYNVNKFNGNLRLTPSSDDWKDVTRRPDVLINIDGNLDAIEFLADQTNVLGTRWGEWETNWSGVVNTSRTQTTTSSDQIVSQDTFEIESRTAADRGTIVDTFERTVIDRTTTTETITTNTTRTDQVRRGIRTELDISTITENLGERVLDVSFVPFIRSRRVYFKAEGLKPNTKHFIFIDEINVGSYATKKESGTFDSNLWRTQNTDARIDFKDLGASAALARAGETGGNRSDLVTDTNGTIEGFFIIPNTNEIRFRTGDRVVKLVDTTDPNSRYATSQTSTTYMAKGLLQEVENTIISTRKVDFSQRVQSDQRSLTTIDVNTDVNSSNTQFDNTELVGTVTIPDPTPTYVLTRSTASVNEGESFTITLTTTNVPDGSTVSYIISDASGSSAGLTTADFNPPLTAQSDGSIIGNFTVANNVSAVTFTTSSDGLTESTNGEVFALTLNQGAQGEDLTNIFAQVLIVDTSIAEPPPPPPPPPEPDPPVDPVPPPPPEVEPVPQNPVVVVDVPTAPVEETWDTWTWTWTWNDWWNPIVNWGWGGWFDPIAETFQTSTVKQTGCYITDIDLFFQAKDSVLPVTCKIVTVENGIPTGNIVPGTEVTKASSTVFTSATGATPTKFKFDFPVYLSPRNEYAFIVSSNSVNYRCWISEAGQADLITGERIDKSPYLGVMFRSSNQQTWTADQQSDIKFKLNRAQFMTNRENSRTRSIGAGTVNQTGTGTITPAFPEGVTTIPATALKLQTQDIILPRTEINYEVTVSGKTYPISPDQTLYLPGQVNLTKDNFKLDAKLTTKHKDVSPAIDIDRLSIVTINNIINNDVTNEAGVNSARNGNATARYIQRLVKLNNPADQIDIFMGINRMTEDQNVRVYIRTEEDGTYTEVLPENTSVPISSAFNVYPEVHYKFENFDVNSPSNRSAFNEFQVKIVLTSTNPANVPTVNDFRAIATEAI